MSANSQGISDLNSLFEALSTKLTSETTKISRDFQNVVDAHAVFKQEVREELDELRRHLILQQSNVIKNNTVPSTQVKSTTSPSVLPNVSFAQGSSLPMMTSANA
jgi:hypothetical protein